MHASGMHGLFYHGIVLGADKAKWEHPSYQAPAKL